MVKRLLSDKEQTNIRKTYFWFNLWSKYLLEIVFPKKKGRVLLGVTVAKAEAS